MRIEIFNGTFWGIILIVFGILLIIKYVFNIQFPIFRILIAVLFIYIGIRMLVGHWYTFHYYSDSNSTVFSDKQFNYADNQNSYNCVFGSAKLDVSDIKITENKTIEVSVVFGEFKVRMRKDQNVRIISNTAFGSTSMPDENTDGFGSKTFNSPGFNENLPLLTIRTNAAFGSIKIFYTD